MAEPKPPADEAAVARRLVGLLDLTRLDEADGEAEAEALCRRAATPVGPVAAVCLWPRFAPLARRLLAGSPIRVATVANFPQGAANAEAARRETAAAVADGADEVDVVVPYGAWLAGHREAIRDLVAACKQACNGRALVKAILETGALGPPSVVAATAREAVAGGADFLKTSTGKSAPGATPEAAEAMLRVIAAAKRPVGFKAAGGIRTLAAARLYLERAEAVMGAGWATPERFRIGASGLLDELLAAARGCDGDNA